MKYLAHSGRDYSLGKIKLVGLFFLIVEGLKTFINHHLCNPIGKAEGTIVAPKKTAGPEELALLKENLEGNFVYIDLSFKGMAEVFDYTDEETKAAVYPQYWLLARVDKVHEGGLKVEAFIDYFLPEDFLDDYYSHWEGNEEDLYDAINNGVFKKKADTDDKYGKLRMYAPDESGILMPLTWDEICAMNVVEFEDDDADADEDDTDKKEVYDYTKILGNEVKEVKA